MSRKLHGTKSLGVLDYRGSWNMTPLENVHFLAIYGLWPRMVHQVLDSHGHTNVRQRFSGRTWLEKGSSSSLQMLSQDVPNLPALGGILNFKLTTQPPPHSLISATFPNRWYQPASEIYEMTNRVDRGRWRSSKQSAIDTAIPDKTRQCTLRATKLIGDWSHYRPCLR